MIFNNKEKDKNKIEVDPILYLASCSVNFKKASKAFMSLSQIGDEMIKAKNYENRLKADPTLDLTDDPEFQKSVIFAKNANDLIESNIKDVMEALESLKVICSMGVRKDEA